MNQIPNIEETNSREQCDCSKYPEQQEVGGHGRYCKHHTAEEIEEHEMTPFESQLAQSILGALEYRGFYDCGKYLDTSLIEHIRPLLHQELQKARKDWLWEEVKKLKVIKRSIEEFDYDCDERGKCEILQTIIDRYHSELDQPTPDIPGFEGTMEALDKLKI